MNNNEMELKTAIEILEYHQEWRQGKRDDMIHEPSKLTEALDIVLQLITEEQQVKNCDLADVVGQNEQFMCYEYDLNGKSKPCKEQCKYCREYQLRADSA